jgi:hypothetical protein
MVSMGSKPFEAQISRAQRMAAARARADGGLTGREIAERAAQGRLTLDGEPVDAFEIDKNYVYKLAGELIQERQGKRASPLAKMRPDDAHEALRVRLINLADAELHYLERQKPGKRDIARFRDVVRACKEAAAIQPPRSRPLAPGDGTPEKRETGASKTASGRTGALLDAHRRHGDEV